MKGIRLKDINPSDFIGKSIEVCCLVKSRDIKTDSRGSQYLKVLLMDDTRELSAVYFGDISDVINVIAPGTPLGFLLEISEYRNSVSAKIVNVYNAPEYTIRDFIPWVDSYDTYEGILTKMLASFTNPVYKTVVTELYKKFDDKVRVVPAATGMHHTQFGGTLAHSVSVALAADTLAANYQQIYGKDFINRELLRAAALLHDIAKAKEISANPSTGEVEYSDWSALHSHIVGCIIEIQKVADEHDFSDSKEVELLIHCIAAHHGKLEFGSPVTPAIPEAELLNTADNLDAAMWRYNSAYKDLKSGEGIAQFKAGQSFKFYKV